MTETGTPPPAAVPSARAILIGTGVALLLAAAVLLAVVLPAEYGLDYLGAGRALGLVAMGEQRPGVLTSRPALYHVDERRFTLGAYQAVEYKYRLEPGDTMVFSWQASSPVIVDMHSQPDGAPEGYAESFSRGTMAAANGTYTAPFGGIHGWYWENPGRDEVTITIRSAGFYSHALEFSGGMITEHQVGNLEMQ
jgi:hypothetical protein